ncbi:ribonuclease III [Candidatus Jorgensenbacteria bacterium]|nr:ribonuclease III [Candidatus Jorgensenbacteria bacterium]
MATVDVKKLERELGVTFNKRAILQEALTHRSYLNENSEWPLRNNERLEYLGDAVLELVVTEYLYAKFPEREEGELTSLRAALVNYQMLARIAKEISLDEYVYLSRGESKDSGRAREVILANTIEAVIGAVHLDQGYDAVRAFVERSVLCHLDEIIEKKLYRDPKSMLQELIQERMKLTPTYRVLKEEGPDHQKNFHVGVYFGDKLVAQGIGLSKQDAELRAAEHALKILTDQ